MLYQKILTDEMPFTSNIYKICALLLTELDYKDREQGADLRIISNVEKALELIYYDYKRDVTVSEAATVTGYGKSNFSKIFKRVTGDSFHHALNKRRIGIAKDLLLETDMTVSAISEDVGFPETKTFCRVFREPEGITPGAYRKKRTVR